MEAVERGEGRGLPEPQEKVSPYPAALRADRSSVSSPDEVVDALPQRLPQWDHVGEESWQINAVWRWWSKS